MLELKFLIETKLPESVPCMFRFIKTVFKYIHGFHGQTILIPDVVKRQKNIFFLGGGGGGV